MPPDYCPHCGAEVPSDARACPECGSDEQTGWSDRAHTDRLGIPDEEFDYEEFVKEEFGQMKDGRVKPHGICWFWWVIAVILLLAFLGLLSR
jgi:zinc ribbon protein